MAKDYTVRTPALRMVGRFHESVMDIDGVAAYDAWPKVLHLARKKDWALDALLRHAVTGRCGGNANEALEALWAALGDDAHDAFQAEIAAGKFDRLGRPVAITQNAMSLHTMLREFP